MSLNDLSAVIIVKNARATIGDTLQSLRKFGEVVVYDNGSDDGTVEICKSFDNVSLHVGEFFGFGKTKAHAVSLAKNDWVFSIDADEAVSEELASSLDTLVLDDPNTAFVIDRRNFFMGKEIRHSGWGNDWILRLFNRNKHGFNDAPVHEKICLAPGGRRVRISGALNHYAIQEIEQVLAKINRYSEIRREQDRKILPMFLIVLKSAFKVFRCYFLQLGFLDGWRGLVIAATGGMGNFFKYLKPLVDQKIAKEKGE